MVNPSGEFIEPQPVSTESRLERFSVHRLHVADSLDSCVEQVLFGDLADPRNAPDGKTAQEVMNLVGLDDK
jgi:hypothetical protein